MHLDGLLLVMAPGGPKTVFPSCREVKWWRLLTRALWWLSNSPYMFLKQTKISLKSIKIKTKPFHDHKSNLPSDWFKMRGCEQVVSVRVQNVNNYPAALSSPIVMFLRVNGEGLSVGGVASNRHLTGENG
jgi:hypothetical protein